MSLSSEPIANEVKSRQEVKLLEAAWKGSLSDVESLLRIHVNVNFKDSVRN
jgi:hypothetical protein